MKAIEMQRLRTESLETRMMLSADVSGMPHAPIGPATADDAIPAVLATARDAHSDGGFDALDMLQRLESGQYRRDEPAAWNDVDWYCADLVDQNDLVQALQTRRFDDKAMGANGAQEDSQNVYYYPPIEFPSDEQIVAGATSELMRLPNGIHAKIKTNGLIPGHVYTMWIIVYNEPDHCIGPCNPPQDVLFNQDVKGTLVYGAGSIANAKGEATFSAYLAEGDTSGYASDHPAGEVPGFPGRDLGLVDSHKAAFTLVVRHHGPKLPGSVSQQLHTFTGGCDPITLAPCADVQFANHVA